MATEKSSITGESVTGFARVQAALRGERPDRAPKGELMLPPTLASEITGRRACEPEEGGAAPDWQVMEEALICLGADMIAVPAADPSPWQEWCQELAYWAGRQFFVWVLVDGLFQGLATSLGWSPVLVAFGRCGRGYGEAAELPGWLLLQMDRILAQVHQALQAGADGVLLGEDVAYSSGLLLPPQVVARELAPRWREVAFAVKAQRTCRGQVPLVGLHSDGMLEPLLGLLQASGFEVIHSLEPEAGMEAARLVPAWRGRLGFMGGFSVPVLVQGPETAIREEAQRLATVALDGGLVVGSSAGVVPASVPARHLTVAYEAIAEVARAGR